MPFVRINDKGEKVYLGSTPKDWVKILIAFTALYLFFALFFAVLFIIAQEIILVGRDSQPCPFDFAPETDNLKLKTNCNNICGGPPQLIQPWQSAKLAGDMAALAAAETDIKNWIAAAKGDETAFAPRPWTDASALDYEKYPMLTGDFYKRIGCCTGDDKIDDSDSEEGLCGEEWLYGAAPAMQMSLAAVIVMSMAKIGRASCRERV